MKHFINKIVQYFANKNKKKKTWHLMTNKELDAALSDNDFYEVCIKSKNNNTVAKAISYFSGPYSHTIVCYTKKQGMTILEKIKDLVGDYYNDEVVIDTLPDHIVLASDDDNGKNFFDMSVYQNREMDIYKLNVPKGKHASILKDFVDSVYEDEKQTEKKPYDSTGLVGQIFKSLASKIKGLPKSITTILKKILNGIYRLFDDERADYCSEGNYDILIKHGIIIAPSVDSTPTEVQEYCEKNKKKVYTK